MKEKIEEKVADAVGQALEAPAKEIGNELADLLNILFTPIQMAKVWRDTWFNDFKAKIQKRFEQIPLDQRITPPLNIIGPAIEASRFYLEEDQMREMFANLVACACDQRMETATHPAFVSILTQMTPLEAAILQSFRPKSEMQTGISITESDEPCEAPELHGTGVYTFPERYLPIVNYHLMSNDQRRTIYSNIVPCSTCTDGAKISVAISNLLRMGLIEVDYSLRLGDEQYQHFLQNQIYKELTDYTIESQSKTGVSISFVRGNMLIHGTYEKIILDKGFARLTQLGFDFTKVCVLGHELVLDIGENE